MRSLIALTRKDLKGYFDQPTGYILIVLFLVLLSWRLFNSLDLTLEASLRPMFSVDFDIYRPSIPWLMAILVPAATMRLFAEEQRDGTLEILLTHPIRGWVVLLAKFLAGFAFVFVALAATVLIPITLRTAGNIDEGEVFSQYFGTLLLAASFVSIGLFTSSLTRNQIVAFMLALALTFALMVVGLEAVASSLPARIARVLQDLSPVTHFSRTARGLIDLGDVLYFVALVSTFLSATYLTIRSKTISHRSAQYFNLILGVAGLVLASLLIGWFGSDTGARLDLTEDNVHTLSGSTEDILHNLDDLLTIKLYTSKDLAPQDELIARRVREFLDEVASKSDKVKIVRKFPTSDESDKIAQEAGLLGIPQVQSTVQSQGELKLKLIYLGMVMTYLDRKETIGFVDTPEGLEYRFASLANRLVRENKKKVAFLTGHGEVPLDQAMTVFNRVLKDQYEVVTLGEPQQTQLDLKGIDVLVVAAPTDDIGPVDLDEITRFLDGGGKALFLIEPVVVYRDPNVGALVAVPNDKSFAPYLKRYGIAVDDAMLVDMRSNALFPRPHIPYPPWARVGITDVKIAGEVETALLGWASALTPTRPELTGLETIPILTTSPFAGRNPFPSGQTRFLDVSPTVTFNVPAADLKQHTVGVAVTGPAPGAEESAATFRLVVIGDADWLADGLMNQPGGDGNAILGLNLIDWLGQEDALAAVRSKLLSRRQLLYDSKTHQNLVEYGNIAGMPVLFIAIGLTRFIIRRNVTRKVYQRED